MSAGQGPGSSGWRWLTRPVSALTTRDIPWIGNVAGLAGILSFLGGLGFYAVALVQNEDDMGAPEEPLQRERSERAPAGDLPKLTAGIQRSFARLPSTVKSCSGGPSVQIDRADLDSAERGALKVFGVPAAELPVKVSDDCWISAIIYTDQNRHDTGGSITFSREDSDR